MTPKVPNSPNNPHEQPSAGIANFVSSSQDQPLKNSVPIDQMFPVEKLLPNRLRYLAMEDKRRVTRAIQGGFYLGLRANMQESEGRKIFKLE